ncbi:heavy metal-associated isoprenylated plant protein 41-like [Heracleum sosnowskyi]|uniref:Heavy metal-associated isoprenylated plant protein 41-like n=1 Tax=Heracleum sosnowskyi TaxID=360622 RepID=A0AAD8N7V9_9APIA|nr:heavy metal-associated isoprenylated plant protein 41-like [Heracleum sosnowskyi]
MKFYSDLNMRKFDRIIFNFPHAGFHRKENDSRLIRMHRRLLDGFFMNACGMLRPDGEIHVNHKTSVPYCHWNLEKLASESSLVLMECVAFKKEDYLGYENKRGSGKRCDDCFLLGECSTFKFTLSQNAKAFKVKRKVKKSQNLAKALKFVPQQPSPYEFRQPPSDLVLLMNDNPTLNIHCGRSRELLQTPPRAFQQGNYLQHRQPCERLQAPLSAYQQRNDLEFRQPRELLQAPLHAHQQGNYLTFRHPPSRFDLHMSGIPERMGSPLIDHIYLECSRIFSPYFEHVAKALKSPDHNSSYFLEEALNVGYERYMAGDPRRTLSDYRCILEQLRKHFVEQGQVSRQLTIEYDFPSSSRSGHFR